MNIDIFRQIRQEIFNIFARLEELDKSEDDSKQVYAEAEVLVKRYFELVAILLDSDLSSIPFEEWEGIPLISEDDLDLSKTRANIDISLLSTVKCNRIILKGCNVRGIEGLVFDEDTFDEDFMRNHPELFPDESIPKEIRYKFFKHKLEFKDLADYPSLRRCINRYSFTGDSRDLVEAIGFEDALRFFDDNPEFILHITTLESTGRFLKGKSGSGKSYEEKRKMIYEEVIAALKGYGIKEFFPLEVIPNDMKESFPALFISNGELPEEVASNYYAGRLSFNEVNRYRDVLQNKDIDIGTRKETGFDNIRRAFGGVWEFFDKIPDNVEYEVWSYLADIGSNQEIEDLKTMSTEEIIMTSIRYAVRHNRDLPDIDTLIAYCDYIPVEEAIPNKSIRNFMLKCGLTILQEYNKKNNYFFDIGSSALSDMSEYSEQIQDDSVISSEEDLKKYLNKIIGEMRLSTDFRARVFLDRHKKDLSEMFPSQFLDYELAENVLQEIPEVRRKGVLLDLENGFNGNVQLLLKLVNEYPELAPILRGKDIIIGNNNDSFYKTMLNTLGSERFLEINLRYGNVINHLIKILPEEKLNGLLAELQNNNNFEDVLNSKTYELITSNRFFDIRCLPESFKTLHKELYLLENAPDSLKNIFYTKQSGISIKDLYEHPEWIEHLRHIDLDKCFAEKQISIYDSSDKNEYHFAQTMSLYKALSLKFSQDEILNIFSKYGDVLWSIGDLSIDLGVSKEQCYDKILDKIYNGMISRNIPIKNDMPEEFKNKYPDIFLDENAPGELQNLFYQKQISPDLLQLHPEWLPILANKSIEVSCVYYILPFVKDAKKFHLSNAKVLEIFHKYGSYLWTCNIRLTSDALSDIDDYIKKCMIYSIIQHKSIYDESAKELIGSMCPELFLDENAPADLKQFFYNYNNNTPLTFELLKLNKEWLPFLKDKNVLLSLKKQNIGIAGLEQLFATYGPDEALKIGMKNPESVMKMLEYNQFNLLSQWYDKLGFIPHHVVMMNFPVEYSDKFSHAGKKWSQIMRIERHTLNDDSKEALLKASMCFGVFDDDIDGFNKLMQLFTDIPKSLSEDEMAKLVHALESELMIEGLSEEVKKRTQLELDLLKKIYVLNEDGIYSLKINSQQHKEEVDIIRGMMERLEFNRVLTPDLAHKLFGGFEMRYDPDFRNFLLENMDAILQSDEYISYISSMQKQWAEIKALNSNRKLTLALALAYVKANSYSDVQVGNEKLAEVSRQAGYSQNDFNTLQQIYNYGKARTFNSIPRIKSTKGQYIYEILRLDDPLAITIGTLTDCCQELGNAAETSMEHSMVDNHGRIFVIKDEAGNIVAQSWVWRNQNVLCFDNIEIPAKAFTRAERSGMTREEFTDTVFQLYQQAAEELIKKDAEAYAKLLEDGKITQEQYESIRLAKVTVGTGYNDIADALNRNAQRDESAVARPLEFVPPVQLGHTLYTSDSISQYVIAGNQDVISSTVETPTIYQDEFVIYDKNSKINDVQSLMRLEFVTKQDEYRRLIEQSEPEEIIDDIAYNYYLNPETTKIIMNANFAIIYDTRDSEIIIGDLLFNTSFNNNGQEIDITDAVAMQIRMAIEQIGITGANVDISRLNQKQIEMLNRALALNEEIDSERGISHGSR